MENNNLHNQQELVRSLTRGDVNAFNSFFGTFYNPLLYYCRHLVQDEEEAKDIVLSTFYKCWERREQFENYLNIRSFLYLVARNACLDHLKRHQRRLTHFREFAMSADLVEREEDYLAMEAEVLKRIYREVAALPGKCRQVFELSFLEGKPVAEVAGLLGISPSNVSSQRARAIQLLRLALADDPLALLLLISVLYSGGG